MAPLFHRAAITNYLGPHLTQCLVGRGLYLRTKWHLDPCSRLAAVDMSRKLEGSAPFLGGMLGPYLTQSPLG